MLKICHQSGELKMYTANQVSQVFNKIRIHLQENSKIFLKEGVFRVPGTHLAAQEIVGNILQGKELRAGAVQNTENFPIHDYLSALKLVFEQSKLLSPNSSIVEELKKNLEKENTEKGAALLKDFVHQLITSTDEIEHVSGQVIYTYLQLAKQALAYQNVNQMNAKNLGIVLGPNFEKLINNDPKHTLPLILKLNDISAQLLLSECFSNDFEKSYASQIIAMKEVKLVSLQKELENLKSLRKVYRDKIREYQAKISEQKKLLDGAKRKDKKIIEGKIAEYEKIIDLYKIDDKQDTMQKIKALKLNMRDLEEEIKGLKKKCGPPKDPLLSSSAARLKDLIDSFAGLITDDEEDKAEELDPKNLLMLPKKMSAVFRASPNVFDKNRDVMKCSK